MNVITPEWLQYGALGLLAMVLAAIGVIVYTRDKESAERLEKQDKWLRDLIHEDRVERKTHLASWQSMVGNDIETRKELVSTMQRINESMKHNCDLQEMRHMEVMTALKSEGN